MYYFDNKNSLFSRLIKNNQLLILNELLKTHSNILSVHLSDVNNKNNILHLLLKQKYSEDDMFFKLNLMTNIIRISKNKKKTTFTKR